MYIELARTFLEIIRSGSFIAAANRLHVTQTTITSRIKTLESLLDCVLFVRNRSGATLTPDGEKFTRYATQLVQTWEKARLDLPLPRGHDTILTIAAEIALWNPLLYRWTSALRKQFPELVLRVETDTAVSIMEKLTRGVLDVALLHRIEYLPGISIEQLLEEKLILVASAKCDTPYLFVDWGEEFRRQHDTAMPEMSRNLLNLDFGPLALQYLIDHGGSGYFRTRVVKPYLDAGTLVRIAHSPEFSYPIYLAGNRQITSATLELAVSVLRQIAKKEPEWKNANKYSGPGIK